VPRNNQQDWQKTDRIDSRNLCKHLSVFSSGAESIKSRLKQLEFMWYEELHISNELRAYCRKHYWEALLYY
jgi:hypothetical protein